MTRSDTIAQLASALSKAQGEIKAATKDATNPHFKSKYADLASVWDACRNPLTKHELAVIQLPSVSDGQVHIVTLLTHGSGEWISETLDLTPGSETPQAIGSAITYGRRYALSAMVGVAPDDDDDGEGTRPANANGQSRTNARSSRDQRPISTPADRPITPAEKQQLVEAAREVGWTGEALQAFITDNYGAWSRIPQSQFTQVMSVLQNGTDASEDDDTRERGESGGNPCDIPADDQQPF